MIKITASICGTIQRDAVVTTNEKGVSHLELVLRVNLPSHTDGNAFIDIPVLVNDGKPEDIKDYTKGNRIIMDGNLSVTKADDLTVMILRDAHPQITYSVPAGDSIKGDLTFTGRIKSHMIKTDKRGIDYLVVSAYSPVKTGKEWSNIWFNFRRFPKKNETVSDITPDWLADGVKAEILGDIHVSSYNGKIQIASRIVEMALKTDVDLNKEEEA